jgi:hypothetical protein
VQAKGALRGGLEGRCACRDDDGADHEVEFVYQPLVEQAVPESAAPRDEDVAAAACFSSEMRFAASRG